MSFWTWIDDCRAEYQKNGDEERLRMTYFRSQAYEFRETDPDRALALLREGRKLAERLREPWWVVYYGQYRAESLIHFKRDYRQVLDLTVQSSLEVRKPLLAQYPGRFGVYRNLISAYVGIDPFGYAEAIQEALDYLE